MCDDPDVGELAGDMARKETAKHNGRSHLMWVFCRFWTSRIIV